MVLYHNTENVLTSFLPVFFHHCGVLVDIYNQRNKDGGTKDTQTHVIILKIKRCKLINTKNTNQSKYYKYCVLIDIVNMIHTLSYCSYLSSMTSSFMPMNKNILCVKNTSDNNY